MSGTGGRLAGRSIRPARPEDAGTVRDIVLAAYARYVPVIGKPPAPMADDYVARVAAEQTWVLVEDGRIDGILVLEDGPERFLLDNIAVQPERQGAGLGRVLLDFAEAEAARRGWDRITLYTHALMRANIAIYAARGYVERDRRQENGFDRVYMIKRLAARS